MINKIFRAIWLCLTQLPDSKLRQPIRQLVQIYNDDFIAHQRLWTDYPHMCYNVFRKGTKMNTIAIRLPANLVKQASHYADVNLRTVPKQIEYWAMLGRCAEDNPQGPCFYSTFDIWQVPAKHFNLILFLPNIFSFLGTLIFILIYFNNKRT